VTAVFKRPPAALLALAVAGCGLSEYEALSLETQARVQRLNEENRVLGEPLKIPPSKDDPDEPLARVFLRAPRGISREADASPRGGMMYTYPAQQTARDYVRVELAFGSAQKDFAAAVLRNFEATASPTPRERQVQPPGRKSPSTFTVHEFDDLQTSYSINIYDQGHTQVAVVFCLAKGRRDAVRKALDLSLESLAVDGDASAARKAYAKDKESPWRLQVAPPP
jgi:hypothetical protein